MNTIIQFTESAKKHIQSILQKHPPGSFFRLSVKQTGCSGYMYVPEICQAKKENDIELALADLPILIDAQSVPLIQGTVVDYVKKNLGASQLAFNNPNAQGLCGCGESFHLTREPER